MVLKILFYMSKVHVLIYYISKITISFKFMPGSKKTSSSIINESYIYIYIYIYIYLLMFFHLLIQESHQKIIIILIFVLYSCTFCFQSSGIDFTIDM